MASIPKKILLAVDGSVHSRAMLDYVGRIQAALPGLTCCLFHVQSRLPPMLVEEAEHDPRAKAQIDGLARRNADQAARILDQSRQVLIRHGLAPDAIETVTQSRVLGLARDVLVRAETVLYDAIVVGRRGLSGVQKLLMGSLTAKLCQHTEIVPVWVVDGDRPQDGYLLAVDGSQNALRAVDHFAFMLTGNGAARATLLHVVPRFAEHCDLDATADFHPAASILTRTDLRCLERFAESARTRLGQAGFSSDRIDFRQIQRTVGIGRAILEVARRQGLGTVVLGRRGSGGAFYSGRVCRHVMEKGSGRAFWLVP
jgi:nucleotide-binding universal stress UspA family protein